MTFVAWLASRLDELNMSPSGLARAAGVSESAVSRWRSGSFPRRNHVAGLADALHVAAEDIEKFRPPPAPPRPRTPSTARQRVGDLERRVADLERRLGRLEREEAAAHPEG